MRILITTFTYPPNKDGVAEACRVMAEGLAELGWSVSVATQQPDEGAVFQSLVEVRNGVSVARFDLNEYSDRNSGPAAEVQRYLDFVRSGNFDVIVNQCWKVWPTTLSHGLFKELNSKKIMVSHGYSGHTYEWARRPTLGLGVWLRGIIWTIAVLPKMICSYDRLIFLSEKRGWGRFFDHTVAGWMKHPGIEVVPNGTDPELIACDDDGFRARHGIGPGPMALCVANYCERKNQKLAVEVFRQANVSGSTLVFIGSELRAYGRALLELDEQLSREAPDCDVLFLEKLTREETFAAFNAMDLFLLTAKAETQPIVLIEAMAAGKPWISTNTGCVDQMEGGLVCDNRLSLVSSLQMLMTDPAQRNTLAAEGLHAAQTKYDSGKCVAKFDAIFKSLLPANPRRS